MKNGLTPPSDLRTGGFGVSYDGEWIRERHVLGSEFGLRAKLLHAEQSPVQRIAVYESETFGRILTLDGCVMLTERDEFVYHEMLVHVPLVSIAESKSILIIGGGDCGAIREVLKHPTVERVVLCELDERVTRVCADWFSWVRPAIDDPRVELVFADGIDYVENRSREFDAVLIDSTDPQGAAIGLFVREFYQAVSRTLILGGVMAAQTESPHWDTESFRTIYQEIGHAFDHVDPFLGHVPTYPSGCWSWARASSHGDWKTHFDGNRAELLASQCRYYNPEVHHAAFTLPGFVREILTCPDTMDE